MAKLNAVIEGRVSDELYEKTIGAINAAPLEYSAGYKNRMIHLVDSVSRGYSSPLEAYQALTLGYVPEHLLARKSKYEALV
jgi:hypothetical protein